MDSNYCQIVKESLNGERIVDERTFSSLAVLEEKLERLKALDNRFAEVEFSPAVRKLAKQKNKLAVC